MIRASGIDEETDRRFMAAALRLARRERGLTSPNPAVGALVARFDGGAPRIVGRGATRPPGGKHGERIALEEAGEDARGATLYVTLEPCSHQGRTPPCADAVIASGVARVVSAMEDPNPLVAGRGHARLRAAGVEVSVGVLEEEARRTHAGHLSAVLRGRPHMMLKLAVSHDGRIAGPGRVPVAITGPESRAQVHLMRAESDAILVGLGTVLADDPLLTVRLPGLEKRSPARLVLDRDLAMPPSCRLIATRAQAPVWAIAAEDAPQERRAALNAAGVDVIALPRPDDPIAMARALHQRGVTRLMIEGGAHVAAMFLQAGAIDEIVMFSSPVEIGPEGLEAPREVKSVLADPAFVQTAERRFGNDRMRIWQRS